MGHGQYKGEDIYKAVMSAMQPAEEAGGPEGEAYVDLMKRIADEATSRVETYQMVACRKQLLQALADDLFRMRYHFNLGFGRPEDPSRNVAAALLESFGSFVASVVDGSPARSHKGEIGGLVANIDRDLMDFGDPQETEKALSYATAHSSAIPDVPNHLTLTKKQVMDLVEALYTYEARTPPRASDAYERRVRTDGATSVPAMKTLVEYYFAQTEWKDGK